MSLCRAQRASGSIGGRVRWIGSSAHQRYAPGGLKLTGTPDPLRRLRCSMRVCAQLAFQADIDLTYWAAERGRRKLKLTGGGQDCGCPLFPPTKSLSE